MSQLNLISFSGWIVIFSKNLFYTHGSCEFFFFFFTLSILLSFYFVFSCLFWIQSGLDKAITGAWRSKLILADLDHTGPLLFFWLLANWETQKPEICLQLLAWFSLSLSLKRCNIQFSINNKGDEKANHLRMGFGDLVLCCFDDCHSSHSSVWSLSWFCWPTQIFR